jgi:hypothetical protein
MKKNYFIFSLPVFGLLLFSLPVFGTINYSRTPSGYTISNPINFSVSVDTIEEFFFPNPVPPLTNFWGFYALCLSPATDCDPYWEGSVFGCYATTTLSVSENVNLPPAKYEAILPIAWTDEDCTEPIDSGWSFEENAAEGIFEVVGGWFSTDFASNTLAYIGNLFTDLSVPIYILIGIMLGMWLIDYLLGIFARKRKLK